MADDLPPLVDPIYATHPSNAGWSTAPGTPMWHGYGVPAQAQHPHGWTAFPGVPWGAAGATPMFPQQPMPGWPPGGSPAVTQLPIPTGTTGVAQGNDEWVNIQPAPGWERKEFEGFGATTPMRSVSQRSHSRSRTPFSGDSSPSSGVSDLSRARSWTGSVRETDKRPPREWRSDFSMSRSPLSSALGSLLQLSPRPRSASRRGSLSVPKVALNPYIRYSASSPNMFLDLRESPDHLRFRELPRPVNAWDLNRFACEPPLPVMIFYSPSFPWYIETRTRNPVGITLHEMFEAIWQCMMTPITQEDYYNNEMDQTAREAIALAWAERCGENADERNRGVRRVDFLMEKVGLEGIVKGKDGYFELRVKKV